MASKRPPIIGLVLPAAALDVLLISASNAWIYPNDTYALEHHRETVTVEVAEGPTIKPENTVSMVIILKTIAATTTWAPDTQKAGLAMDKVEKVGSRRPPSANCWSYRKRPRNKWYMGGEQTILNHFGFIALVKFRSISARNEQQKSDLSLINFGRTQ